MQSKELAQHLNFREGKAQALRMLGKAELVHGKTLSIAWNGYPKPEAAEMNMLGGGFSWSGASIFSAVGPFKSPSQLMGKFEGGTSTVAPAVGQATVSQMLIFKADGLIKAAAWPQSRASRTGAWPKPAVPLPTPAIGSSMAGF